MSIKRRVETLEQHEVGDGRYYIFQVGGRFKEIQSHQDFFDEWQRSQGIKPHVKDLAVMLILDFHSDIPPEFMYSSPVKRVTT